MTNDSIRTLAELPFFFFGRHPKDVFLRQSAGDGFRSFSTREVFERIRDVSLGLTALGLHPGDRVAIASDNRPEWPMADLAILTAGGVTVPVYPTLAPSQVRYLLADSGARFIIVADEAQAAKVQQVWGDVPGLQAMIVLDPPASGPPVATAAERGRVRSFAEIAEVGHARLLAEDGLGRRFRDAATAIRAEQLATIIYTSGTTGDPKGVMLSHGNLVSNLLAAEQVLPLSSDDVALSFLPLSHSFERLVLYEYLHTGVTVTFAESVDTIARDLVKVRPTVMTGVPRVYEKLRARVMEAIAQGPPLRRRLARWAFGVGTRRARARLAGRPVSPLLALQHRLADRLVLGKIRERTGGRLRYAISGSAPLPVVVAEFLLAVGVPVVEGYGLTETAPVLTVNPIDAPRLGTVGRAIPGVELRIAEDGEILARGPNVMLGYYNKPEATCDVIRDGWFHTGDVGRLDSDGYLTITDRKKDLIITSSGKNVAPQPIEGLLKRHPLVAETMLVGDGRRFVAAVIVPDFPMLEARLREAGRMPGDRAGLLELPETQGLFQQAIEQVNGDLARHEQIKKFVLLPAEFSIAGGELTPTLKVRRRAVEERWRDRIEAIYAE